jgi:hypothetical protein
MLNNLKVGILVFVFFISGCAGNYKTSSGKQRNGWIDLLVVAAAVSSSSNSALTTGFVKGYLSEDDYSGNCACPYDTAEDGSRCGARSAWSRPDGASPNCDYDLITTPDFDDRWEQERQ